MTTITITLTVPDRGTPRGRIEWERQLRPATMPWHVKGFLLLLSTFLPLDGPPRGTVDLDELTHAWTCRGDLPTLLSAALDAATASGWVTLATGESTV